MPQAQLPILLLINLGRLVFLSSSAGGTVASGPSTIFFHWRDCSIRTQLNLPLSSWAELGTRGAFHRLDLLAFPRSTGTRFQQHRLGNVEPHLAVTKRRPRHRDESFDLAQHRGNSTITYLSCSWRPGSNRSEGWPTDELYIRSDD